MSAAPVHRLTPEQYLELDRAAEIKSEFHDGQLFPIVNVSYAHSRIALSFASALHLRLRDSECETAIHPIRVRVSPIQYVYPDIVVTCGKPHFTDEAVDTITNPKIVVEVLSPSTADYDYGGKFALYRSLESIQEYILVAQDQPRIERFQRQADHSWRLDSFGADAVIAITSLGIEIPAAEVYHGILFPSGRAAGPA